MIAMKLFFIVHGFVQGVGYRSLVKRIAERHSVRGMVRNADDGAVEIFAEADEKALMAFENDIYINMEHGPSVVSIERYNECDSGFPKAQKSCSNFVIEQ